jgi:hypothetical protein
MKPNFMSEVNRRIKFSFFLPGWEYGKASMELLKNKSEKITPSEYRSEMDGSIFCPICYTNLNRIPKDKNHFSNGRGAHFAHMKKFNRIECDLRSKKPEGKRYDTFEEVQKAIDDENLVIVSSFLKDRPALPENSENEYSETPVEDMKGPVSDVPISRHNGESFRLPSRIKTVLGICRKFDENLYRYYYLPENQYAIRLVDLLRDIRNVTGECNIPKLYYGKIKHSFNAGRTPGNIRMTALQCNSAIKDFYFKNIDRTSQEKGINDLAIDRVIIIYGRVTTSGIGLCIENAGWGEFALLPEKYNDLLI